MKGQKNYFKKWIIYLERKTLWFLMVLLCSCVRTYDVDEAGFKSALVVEGFVTDHAGEHRVWLSNSGSLSNPTIKTISDANVVIIEDELEEYPFELVAPGEYAAVDPNFTAFEGHTYHLEVELNDGNLYKSDEVLFMKAPPIASLGYKSSSVRNNLNQIEQAGISIELTNESSDDASAFFRYTSEETWLYQASSATGNVFKISFERNLAGEPFRIISLDTLTFGAINKICWFSDGNNNLRLADSEGVEGGVVRKANVHEAALGVKMLYRYSVLINQYALSQEGYNYYKLNSLFSEGDGLLFNQQPGYVAGNIYSIDGNGQVLGIFQASGKTSKRINISYNDLSSESKAVVEMHQIACEKNEVFFTPLDSCEQEFVRIPDEQLTLDERLLKDSLLAINIDAFGLVDSLIQRKGHWVLDYEIEELECDGSVAEAQIVTSIKSCADCTAIGGTTQAPEWWND